MVIGNLKNSYVFVSDTCALDIIGSKFVSDVENGDFVYVENDKLKSIIPFPIKIIRPCDKKFQKRDTSITTRLGSGVKIA